MHRPRQASWTPYSNDSSRSRPNSKQTRWGFVRRATSSPRSKPRWTPFAKLTWVRLKHTVHGDREASLEEATSSVEMAQARVGAAIAAKQSLTSQQTIDLARADQLRSDAETVGPLTDRLAIARWHASNDPRAAELAAVLAHEARLAELAKDLAEADAALLAARDAGDQMARQLGSAHAWGTYDTWFGGGAMASAVKHNKIDASNAAGERLRACLTSLRTELDDVGIQVTDLEITPGRRALDIWFDNIFTDERVQADISAQQQHVTAVQQSLGQVAGRLGALRSQLQTELADCQERRKATNVQ